MESNRVVTAVPRVRADAVSWAARNGAFALDPVTVEIGAGRLVAIIGPSGAGKTTLLELLAGVRVPTGGAVRGPAEVGFVPQDDIVHPQLPMARTLTYAAGCVARPRRRWSTTCWPRSGSPTGGTPGSRRSAAAERKAVSVGIPWHTMAPDQSAFEDGTLNFLSIPDVHFGLDWLAEIGLEVIGDRVRCLTGWFLSRLTALRHSDGSPLVEVYGPLDTSARGGTVAFNFLDTSGQVVDERLVAAETSNAGISLRTGCFCNPGAGEGAFDLNTGTLRSLRHARTKSLDEYLQLLGLPSAGAVRVSFGLASTIDDVERFIAFAEETYRDRLPGVDGLPPRDRC